MIYIFLISLFKCYFGAEGGIMTFRKKLLIASLLLFTLGAEALTITSLNIEWFGRGGSIKGEMTDEYRRARLRDFLLNQIPATDVFVFQEITNPQLLQVYLPELDCQTYNSDTTRHQFVVLCARMAMELQTTANHNVQLGNPHMRAAIVGTVKSGSGKRTQIIGLHLKAGPDHTLMRLDQVRQLDPDLHSEIPTIVIGDFNTYPKDRTGLPLNDALYMDQIFQIHQMTQVPLEHPTYLGFKNRYFDRAWVRGANIEQIRVFGPCNESSVPPPYSSQGFYKRFVSDHCALQVQLGE